MQKSRVVGLVTGAHVVAFGGLLLSQGCGTTRAPLPRDDEFVMPPTQEQEVVRPVPVEPTRRPAPIPPRVEPRPVTPPTETTTYTVAPGDVLSVIASRYDVTVQEIMRINNISNPDMIRVGQRLELPGKIDVDQPREVTPRRETAPRADVARGDRYVVKAGDSLSVIAHRYGVTQQALMRANNISNPDRIQVGQELVIPEGGRRTPPVAVEAPTVTPPEPVRAAPPVTLPRVEDEESGATMLPPSPSAPSGAQTYTVEIGDDLISVASEFNVSIVDLRKANNLDSDILVPGHVLIIPDVE